MEEAAEITQEEVQEVADKAQAALDVIAPDPRIAQLEAKVLSLQGKASQLNADLAVANILIGRLRTAKNAYKALALQGVNEVRYAQKYSPHNYIDRRAIEFPAEYNAVQDVE